MPVMPQNSNFHVVIYPQHFAIIKPLYVSVLQLMKILGHPADHPVSTLDGPHNFWMVRHKNIGKKICIVW